MTVDLNNATEVLTVAGLALLLLPPFRGKKPTAIIVGGALALLAILLAVKHLSASA